MNMIRFGGALAFPLLLAACGENASTVAEDRQFSDTSSRSGQAGSEYSATGEVTAIAGDQVTISHGPVEGIGWPAMTMSFRAGSPEMARGVNVGDQVAFGFKQDGSAYTLTSLSKGE